MQSRWKGSSVNDSQDLELLAYVSRLMGEEPDLVLAGGGNTSLKTTTGDHLGRQSRRLYIKPSGVDLAVDRQGEFTLTALDLAEGTPDEAVRWRQTAGPDVTDGAGELIGASAEVVAPDEVKTLEFELEVAGGDAVATDAVVVRVFEDADAAVFVDGERGRHDGAGTPASPYRSIGVALSRLSTLRRRRSTAVKPTPHMLLPMMFKPSSPGMTQST